MRVLALDPATCTGWAVWSDGAIVASGTWDLSVKRDESGGMRLIRLRGKLTEILGAYHLDLLVFERAAGNPKRLGALVVSSEIQGVIKVWCDDRGIPYRGFSPSEVKTHATRNGNANKKAMLAAAVAKWPDFNGDDNEADARWLAVLAVSSLGERSAA